MKGFSIIVATDVNQGIGLNNRLPWHLPEDMQHFKEVTTAPDPQGRSNVLIMGRKTWESLPAKFRPLPGRRNVVITADPSFIVPPEVCLFNSFERAVAFFCLEKPLDFGEVFVIGGARVYMEAIRHDLCRRIYQTRVGREFKCDTFFPNIPLLFSEKSRKELVSDGGVTVTFITLDRYLSSGKALT